MNNTIKYKNGTTPVILGIDKNRNIVGNPNIQVQVQSPSSSGFTIGYTFSTNVTQAYFTSVFRNISKNIATSTASNNVFKNISETQPDHLGWPTSASPCFVFMSDYSTITTFSIAWLSVNGTLESIRFLELHPELLSFSGVANIRSLTCPLHVNQDPSLLPKLRQWYGGYSSSLKNLPSLKVLDTSLSLSNNPSIHNDLLTGFPMLRQLKRLVIGLDLKYFWNGNPNRMSVNLGNFTGTSWTYTGGAIFPKVFSDDPFVPLDYILNQGENDGKLTGTALSRFYVDFANQVESITSNARRIKLIGSSPDMSYPGVEAAIAKIIGSVASGGLNITIQYSL